MPTQPCPNEAAIAGSKIVAQTLFLGSSINGFNTSMGWGGQPSQLTVTLVDDIANEGCIIGRAAPGQRIISGSIAEQYPSQPNDDGTLKMATDSDDSDRFSLNHYHDCTGNGCYVNEKGTPFDSSMDISKRMVPGKVYYKFDSTGAGSLSSKYDGDLSPCFKSRYWYNPDPGFFGQPNRINPNNTYNAAWRRDNSNLNKGYDIIDTPVLFRVGNFTFGGLIQSWTKQIGSGGNVYSVTINSMQSLLNNCYIIIGGYAGAIYSKLTASSPQSINSLDNNSLFGGPRNYTGHVGVDYFGKIFEGNIPNVFNVYGFLESFGRDGFGGSKLTTEGIPANDIVDALSVLTSSLPAGQLLTYRNSTPSFAQYGKRTAFSPFGRILSKCMVENDTYIPIAQDFKRFGVIPPTPVINDEHPIPTNRCQFLLDLSEIPRLPRDFRISGPVITITDLLNTLSEQAGFDYYVDLVPLSADGTFYNVIKVRTISRLAQPRQNEIEATIKTFQCNQYAISSLTIGKEKNDTSARAMIVGGPVQRLYQAKSYRLAYTQSNYIYDPRENRFIDYMQLGKMGSNFSRTIAGGITKQFHHGKIKIPSTIDLHNPELSNIINPNYAGIYRHNDQIKKTYTSYEFKESDEDWSDNKQLGSDVSGKATGNYDKGKIIKQEDSETASWGTAENQRFFPLFKDVICPFFGFNLENEFDVNVAGSNNDFKRIRPVWFDTWTGQIAILMKVQEIPETSIKLENLYTIAGVQYFLVTESEIRAALAGFDEFLVYCLSKTYRTDLVEMLRKAYVLKAKNKYMAEGLAADVAELRANEKHDWYWRLLGEGYNYGLNIAGDFLQTIEPVPDKAEGTYSIDKDALRDLQAVHGFIAEVGKYYGKKYMVVAPYVAGYKDSSFAEIALPTQAGTAYVFRGGGNLHFSYNPTNDGAWEEYGNIIDNCIAAGSKEYYSLSDDTGKIKPILGYNANDTFDYRRYEICKLSQAQFDKFTADKLNPFWSFENWDIMKDKRDNVCADGSFVFPALNYSSLPTSDYILVEVSGSPPLSTPIFNQYNIPNPTNFAPFAFNFTRSKARDAFGKILQGIGGGFLNMKKLFVTTQVDESIVFLDPDNLKEPRILIDAPGLFLNNSSDEFAKDPNRTIIANVAMEDLNIYMYTTRDGQRDVRWIRQMLSHIYTVVEDNGFAAGNASNSANQAAKYAQLAPKMAHPFFVGIPLKSNIYNYGPWTNYPYIEYLNDPLSVFPSGYNIKQSDDLPPVCTPEIVSIDPDQAKRAVDNWIMPTSVDMIEDYTPWNYGGMAFLDSVAMNDARSRTNYQSIIETAQIDMPGLPLFNLGGTFSYGNYGAIPSGVKCIDLVYTDVKINLSNPMLSLPDSLPILFSPLIPQDSEDVITYVIPTVKSIPNSTGGPVITNIQTSVNQGGILTTYSFRTYTRKLGFFNKENSDRVKRMHLDNLRRNKQFAQIAQQSANTIINQTRNLQNQRLSNNNFSNQDFRSKLFGWSPSKVLIGQSYPYLARLQKTNNFHDGKTFSALPGRNNDRYGFKIPYGNDPGDNAQRWISEITYISQPSISIPALGNEIRQRTDVGLFEEKEVRAQIDSDYGLQSMMSLDGIFSPVSFYPTLKHSTYNFGFYSRSLCPFCSGTKKISVSYLRYQNTGYGTSGTYNIYCDKCINPEEKLNIKLKSNITSSASSQSLETLPPYIITSGTDLSALLQYTSNSAPVATTASTSTASSSSSQAGISIPINMVSLQPIVVPWGEFRNPNVQHYSGPHPEGVHGDLSINAYNSSAPRTFFDKCRHSIEVVGRGSVNPKDLNIAKSLTKYTTHQGITVNADYYDKDLKLSQKILDRTGVTKEFQNNQRFMGLRGPIVMHGWGYDLEGYPVPNAADEPREIDEYGRPKRFKLKIKDGYPKNVKFKDLNIGDLYKYSSNEYVKERNLADGESMTIGSNISINNNSDVQHQAYEDDLADPGGFPSDTALSSDDRLGDYQGSIISKTQTYEGGKWTAKKKLKQFYLNWAERPDLWPVGPIDFRWDESRKVWATKGDSLSSIYKMVYATLEEDLVKDRDNDETYPARAFLDDTQYSTEPLANGLRRLIFIKDRGGYTAPRGAKLLCRYDKDTGFYEPVSKQSFVAPGLLGVGNTATIELSYIAGRKKGEIVPTMLINFENPFDFNIISGNKGLFTFMNGKWTLTAAKET